MIKPISATISWTSSNPRIGTIDQAALILLLNQSGTTTIYCKQDGTFSGTATVTSTPNSGLNNVYTVSPSTASVIVGETENFYFSPEDQFWHIHREQPWYGQAVIQRLEL